MVGKQIGSYRIDAKIGEGGMGTVYRATEVELQRTVAIKVLHADVAHNASLGERFRQEARSQANLNHANIAILYTLLMHEGLAMMVMEYVSGENFQQMVLRQGRIPSEQALPLFKQALLGIGYAHRMGIVHRDIKPANLMLNNAGIVKVMDFGIAKAAGERGLTRTGTQVGTVQYMSPEQVKSENVDSRSDIYALGITLYEMLSGRVPFIANSEFDVLTDHVKTPPPPPSRFDPSIPKGLEGVVLKALAKNPNDRFQTAEEFGAALEHPERFAPASAAPTAEVNLGVWASNPGASHLGASYPGKTRVDEGANNYATRYEIPPPPPPSVKLQVPPPPPPPLAQRKRDYRLPAAMVAGGLAVLSLAVFAGVKYWPHSAPDTAVIATAPVNAPASAPVATPVPETVPTVPPGALEPAPSAVTPSEPAHNATHSPTTKAPASKAAEPNAVAATPVAVAPPPPPPPLAPMPLTVPASQEIVVRVKDGIDAAGTQKGLIYSCTIETAVVVDGKPAIPAGAAAEIEVSDFAKPGRIKTGGRLDLALHSITIKGHKYPIASDTYQLTAASRPKKGGKFKVLGAVAHGVKDAVGAGGSGAAVADLDVAAESLLSFHLTMPLNLSVH